MYIFSLFNKFFLRICESPQMKKNKIIICTNYDYCGGTLVLSQLCKCLCSLGYDARLFPLEPYPSSVMVSSYYHDNYKRITIKTICKLAIYRLFPLKYLYERLHIKHYFPNHLKGCHRQWGYGLAGPVPCRCGCLYSRLRQ